MKGSFALPSLYVGRLFSDYRHALEASKKGGVSYGNGVFYDITAIDSRSNKKG